MTVAIILYVLGAVGFWVFVWWVSGERLRDLLCDAEWWLLSALWPFLIVSAVFDSIKRGAS